MLSCDRSPQAGEEVRVEDPRLLQLHRLLSEPLGPLKKAMVEQQLQSLGERAASWETCLFVWSCV